MYIVNLGQIGQIFLMLSQEWNKGTTRITIKKEGEKPFDNVLVDSRLKVDTIYKYLLENWQDWNLQIFCKEDPAKHPVERFR